MNMKVLADSKSVSQVDATLYFRPELAPASMSSSRQVASSAYSMNNDH